MEKYIFITGIPRSGTTFLMNIINSSDNFKITPEVNFPKLVKRSKSLFYREKSFAKKLWIKDYNLNHHDDLERYLDIIPSYENCISELINTIYGKTFETAPNDCVWGDKYPLLWREPLDDCFEIVKNPIFILIYREHDGLKKSYENRLNRTKKGLDLFPYNLHDLEIHLEELWNFYISINNNHPCLLINYDEANDTKNLLKRLSRYIAHLNDDQSKDISASNKFFNAHRESELLLLCSKSFYYTTENNKSFFQKLIATTCKMIFSSKAEKKRIFKAAKLALRRRLKSMKE